MYEWMGRAHAALARERGQGTVEYVGLILLVGVLITGVLAASGTVGDSSSIAKAVMNKLKDAIESVNGPSK
jgi:hypothetical protein